MDLVEELKKGSIITISKKGFVSTSFRCFNNEILYKNKELTGSGWCKHPSNFEEIRKHFEKMKKEDHKIYIEKVWE